MLSDDRGDPEANQATFFKRSPVSGREGLFVAIDLELSDVDAREVIDVYCYDISLWMYFEGEDPTGPDIAYFEVDSTMTQIIGPA